MAVSLFWPLFRLYQSRHSFEPYIAVVHSWQDHLQFGFALVAERDGDGVEDNLDNGKAIANPDQLDTDGDGYGNSCDGDFRLHRWWLCKLGYSHPT